MLDNGTIGENNVCSPMACLKMALRNVASIPFEDERMADITCINGNNDNNNIIINIISIIISIATTYYYIAMPRSHALQALIPSMYLMHYVDASEDLSVY